MGPFGGFSPETVQAWHQREHDEEKPSSLNDFYRSHSLCATYTGSGKTIVSVKMRDASRRERNLRIVTEEAPSIAHVYDHYLGNVATWVYLRESCAVCRGTGRMPSATPSR